LNRISNINEENPQTAHSEKKAVVTNPMRISEQHVNHMYTANAQSLHHYQLILLQLSTIQLNKQRNTSACIHRQRAE